MNGAAAIVGAIAALLGSLGTYWLAVRRFSGKISTTEAQTLWAEADKLRKEYKESAADLRVELERCHQRMKGQEETIAQLAGEIGRLNAKVAEQAATIAHLEEELAHYKGDHES